MFHDSQCWLQLLIRIPIDQGTEDLMRIRTKAFFTCMAMLVGFGLAGCDGVDLEDEIVSRLHQRQVLTPQCVEDRELAARDALTNCIDRADGARCEREATAIVEGRPCDRPEPPMCDDICRRRAQQVVATCRANGGSPEECERAAAIARDACTQLCEEPDPNCREICVKRSFHIFRDCLRDGGRLLQCAEEGRAALRSCLRACEEPDPPACEQICGRRARAHYNQCIEDGNDPEECGPRARHLLSQCVEECNPAPPSCEDTCGRKARQVFHECVEAGGDEEECGVRARRFHDHCLEECEEPDPPVCEDICRRRARVIFNECIMSATDELSHGAAEERCGRVAREFLERCLTDCNPPPTCDDICKRRARGAYQACIEDRGSPEECGKKAEEVRDRCLDACDPPGQCCDAAERPGVGGTPICFEGATCCASGQWACNEGDGTPTCEVVGRVCPIPCLEACLRDSRGVLDECLSTGEGMDTCADMTTDHVDSCEVICPSPIPPPPPCMRECELDTVGEFGVCIDSGLSDEVCGGQALDAQQECPLLCPVQL